MVTLVISASTKSLLFTVRLSSGRSTVLVNDPKPYNRMKPANVKRQFSAFTPQSSVDLSATMCDETERQGISRSYEIRLSFTIGTSSFSSARRTVRNLCIVRCRIPVIHRTNTSAHPQQPPPFHARLVIRYCPNLTIGSSHRKQSVEQHRKFAERKDEGKLCWSSRVIWTRWWWNETMSNEFLSMLISTIVRTK